MKSIRVEAENYKSGKQGVDYSIKTPQNTGVYRKDGGDVAATPNASNGYLLGWVQTGDWLTYDINVPDSGSYNIVAHEASALKNTSMGIGISVDGKQQGNLQFGSTGGWTAWQDVQSNQVSLSAGNHTLRVDVLGGGFNLDYLDLVPVDASSTNSKSSSKSTPSIATAPAGQSIRVEAENYKSGGQGVGYNIKSPQNGGVYRQDGVDIASTPNASNGYLVGWIQAGDSLNYDVNVQQSGAYNIIAHVASALQNTNMRIGVSVDGGTQQTLQFGGTGGWTSWQDIKSGNVNLSTGQHTLRVDVLAGGFNLDYLDITPTKASPTPQSATVNLGNTLNAARTGSNSYTASNGTDTISYAHSGSALNANLTTGNVYHFLASSSTPLKIMAVGDSITAGLQPTADRPGVEIGGYRDKLRNLLAGNGFNVSFVGPSSNGPDDLDKNHAGYPGDTIDQIANQLSSNNILSNYQPDKVLLLAGTNDILHSDPSQAPSHLSSLIDQITNQLPDAQVLVASIPPLDGSKTDATFPQAVVQYDSVIPGIVNSEVAKGKNVSYVDIFNSLNTSDLVDGVHPGDAGNSKIAQTWYNGLIQSNSGTDTLSNFKNIIGSKFNDSITAGNDNSIIDGGGGNDLLTGGKGRDTFVLAAGRQGTATINNFTEGKDLLGLSNGLKFDQLSITQGSDNYLPSTSIGYNGQQLALLKGVQANTITNNDFVYV